MGGAAWSARRFERNGWLIRLLRHPKVNTGKVAGSNELCSEIPAPATIFKDDKVYIKKDNLYIPTIKLSPEAELYVSKL